MSTEIRDLIRQMSLANPLWGAPRIHGELLRLGIEVSQATVGRYPPWRPIVLSPTWHSFLRNHMADIVAVDMFTVATATFRILYALIVLGHDRRKVIHFDVTQNPTQVCLSRQMTEAFPWDTAPRYLLRDRDASYGSAFRDRVRVMGMNEVVTAPRSPWQNPYVERSSARSAANAGSHHHLQQASLAARPLQVFSISSLDKNTSVTRQGLSAASPPTASLCRRHHRVPGGGRSASSLRTSRRLISEVNETTRRFRREGSLHFPTAVPTHDDRARSSFTPVVGPAMYRPAHEFSRDHLQPDSHAKYIFEQRHRDPF